jgi:hypothetical protein
MLKTLLIAFVLVLPSLASAQVDPTIDGVTESGDPLIDYGLVGSPIGIQDFGIVTSPIGPAGETAPQGTWDEDEEGAMPVIGPDQGLVGSPIGVAASAGGDSPLRYIDLRVDLPAPAFDVVLVGDDESQVMYIRGALCPDGAPIDCYAGRSVLVSTTRTEHVAPDGTITVTTTTQIPGPPALP